MVHKSLNMSINKIPVLLKVQNAKFISKLVIMERFYVSKVNNIHEITSYFVPHITNMSPNTKISKIIFILVHNSK